MDLSLNLKAVVSQRLIPTVDGQGRRAAIEVLINTPLMSDLILKGEIHEMKGLMKKSGEAGMKTFDQALYELFKEGAITQEEALRNADSPNEVRLLIKLGDDEDGGSASELGSTLDGLTLDNIADDPGLMR
jgi:twitching motility protein PilU